MTPPPPPFPPPPPRDDSEPAAATALWEAAARCYLQADEREAASACLERAGRDSEAAVLYEGMARWRDAARCHRRLGAHAAAARCLEAAEDWDEAAASHERAGQWVRAAWLRVHALGWHLGARATLAAAAAALAAGDGDGDDSDSDSDDGDALGAALVEARCAAAAGSRRDAARLLDLALREFAAPSASAARCRLRDWAVAVADDIARPDLGARAHVRLGRGSGADLRAWDAWSLRVLGEHAPYPGARTDGADSADGAGD